jgi:hypothetical protein
VAASSSGKDPVPISRSLVGVLGSSLAVGAALVAIHAGAPTPSAAAPRPHRLLPDLTTMRMHSHDLRIDAAGKKVMLQLTNRIANHGRGPLEIYPSAKSHDCDRDGDPTDDRDAFQRVFLDTDGDRIFRRSVDTDSEHFRFGCKRYDPGAGHWNVFDLARYELRRPHGGKTVAKTTKVAYCTVDSDLVSAELPGSPARSYYPRGGCRQDSILGISIGWSDEYYYRLAGQEIDVTGVKAGRYCLVSTGDPDNLLREADNSNNTRKTRIELDPAGEVVRKLPGRCG